MSKNTTVLRQVESYKESRLPPGIRRLERPRALGRAVELAFLRWERRNLRSTEGFWRDFGMQVVSTTPDRVVVRGLGTAPCVAIADKGRRDRFVGAAFRMSDDTDLLPFVKEMGARWLQP